MIRSMTGFGACDLDTSTAFISVEVHSVNHRHLQVKSRMPLFCQSLAGQIEKLIRGVLSRGSVSYNLIIRPHGETLRYIVDWDVLRGYIRQLEGAKELPADTRDVALRDLLQLPGAVVEQTPDNAFVRDLWAQVEGAVTRALEELAAMRSREGTFLATELRSILTVVHQHVETISKEAPQVTERYRDRLHGRLDRLLEKSDVGVSDELVAREIALFADRGDITEEIARLRSHLEQFAGELDSDGPVGRKLEFLTQEMFREATTMLAKAGDAQLASHALALKTEVEKLREQALNIE